MSNLKQQEYLYAEAMFHLTNTTNYNEAISVLYYITLHYPIDIDSYRGLFYYILRRYFNWEGV